jgi:hypothetical protein
MHTYTQTRLNTIDKMHSDNELINSTIGQTDRQTDRHYTQIR